MFRLLLPVCFLIFFIQGCTSSLGPRSIPVARYQYNEAIGRSQDEQMLLNLVRLRYQDSPLFLDLDSVVASYSISADLNLNATILNTTGDISRSLSSENKFFGWSDNPTVTYTPLKGDDFAKRTMAPIKPDLILLLSQGGWGIERLLICCVQQINRLPNARRFVDLPKSAGNVGIPLFWISKYREFQRTASLLRSLQDDGYIQFSPGSEENQSFLIIPGPIPLDEKGQAVLREVAGLLDVSNDFDIYLLKGPGPSRKPAEIQLRTRSLLATMAFLAQGVDVPESHQKEGLVRNLTGAKGDTISAEDINLGFFRVSCSTEEPRNTRVKVYYRDHWFWIRDNDLESKGTFTLLNQIFNLQAASNQSLTPVLTLPKPK